jgi:PAS domain S-box-containing protein
MDKALTVVCLEDDPLDAELVRKELATALPELDWRHVATEPDYRAEIGRPKVDLILSDYNLPNFDGLSALKIAHEARPLTPFIFVSGALGEEIAIETLKSGATDYVLKNRLKRLGPAVQRALAEASERSERRRVQRELDAQRSLLEALINTIPDIIYAVDREGRALAGNQALLQFINRGWEDVRGQRLAEFMLVPKGPDRRSLEDDYLMRTGRQLVNRERVVQRPGGENHWYSTSKALLRDPTTQVVAGLVCVSRDVTANRLLEQELSEISNREQRRIGSDLHDGLGQELTGLSLMLRGIETAVTRDAPQLTAQVTRVREVLAQAIESTRALARGLSPVNLERGGLPAALEHLAHQCRSVYGLHCDYRGSLKPNAVVDETSATHLYRIAQEAIANAAKHAKAQTIMVTLGTQGEGLLLEIKDDGSGIPEEQLQHAPGMGLRLMEYRARIMGGELTVGRGEGSGTTIACFCPLTATGRFVRPRGRRSGAR